MSENLNSGAGGVVDNGKIPKLLWQTYKSLHRLPAESSPCISSWIRLNPGWEYHFCSDEIARETIEVFFDQELLDIYDSLPLPVMKADLWRYAVLWEFGGIYTDIDTICLESLDRWLDSDQGLHVAVEEGHPLFCQWTIISEPRHPVMRHALDLIKERVAATGGVDETMPHYVHHYTGPGLWTAAINRHLDLDLPYHERPDSCPEITDKNITIYPGNHFDGIKSLHFNASSNWRNSASTYTSWMDERKDIGRLSRSTLSSNLGKSRLESQAIPLVAVPVLNRGDLLERFVNSIDAPVARLLIINNGRDPSVMEALSRVQKGRHEFIDEITVVSSSHNIGVAPSWNAALRVMLANHLPYAVIAGSDIRLAEGDLDKFRAAYDSQVPLQCGNHGYSLFMITPKAVDLVGAFDENFYPAYLEDCDYTYRLKRRGFDCRIIPEIFAQHGDSEMTGSCTIQSDPVLFNLNLQTHERNFGYYRRKWGGANDSETYEYPFDNSGLDLSFWQIDPGHRSANSSWPETT